MEDIITDGKNIIIIFILSDRGPLSDQQLQKKKLILWSQLIIKIITKFFSIYPPINITQVTRQRSWMNRSQTAHQRSWTSRLWTIRQRSWTSRLWAARQRLWTSRLRATHPLLYSTRDIFISEALCSSHSVARLSDLRIVEATPVSTHSTCSLLIIPWRIPLGLWP